MVAVGDVAKSDKGQVTSDMGKCFLLDVPNIVDDIGIGNEILIEDGLMKIAVKEKK